MANGDNRIAIDFIDPLFAVALHINFVEVMHEAWFLNLRLMWQPDNAFAVLTILLGYSAVVTSWVGYHQSVQKRQINVDNPYGQTRFFLDIVLLLAYFFLLVNFRNFSRELWALVFIFAVFVLWDWCKKRDWPRDTPNEERVDEDATVEGRGITVFWFICVIIVALLYTFTPADRCKDLFVLVAMIISIWLYRQHKKHHWFKSLIFNLGRPKGGA
jgi:Ca2+/Na+ antiporter